MCNILNEQCVFICFWRETSLGKLKSHFNVALLRKMKQKLTRISTSPSCKRFVTDGESFENHDHSFRRTLKLKGLLLKYAQVILCSLVNAQEKKRRQPKIKMVFDNPAFFNDLDCRIKRFWEAGYSEVEHEVLSQGLAIVFENLNSVNGEQNDPSSFQLCMDSCVVQKLSTERSYQKVYFIILLPCQAN